MINSFEKFKQGLFALGQEHMEAQANIDQTFQDISALYENYVDPFGFNPEKTKTTMKALVPIYLNYFRTRIIGAQHLADYPQDKPLMVVSNHTGQLPFDGMLICMAFAASLKPGRYLRGMVERFVNTLPFIGTWVGESGAVLGDRANCLYLLGRGESILVFPEGARGIAKNSKNYYQLQKFTPGFFRMALAAGVDIVPITVVGAEEFYPWVHHSSFIAKLLNLPAFPLAPNYLLGPLGLLPLPSPIDIHIGPIFETPKDVASEAPDDYVDEQVENIKSVIQNMLNEGLRNRRSFFNLGGGR